MYTFILVANGIDDMLELSGIMMQGYFARY